MNAGGQAATVGLLPPSDSEDESSDDEGAPRGQNPKAGEMPTSDSESDSDDSSSDEDEAPAKSKAAKPAVPEPERRRKDDEIDPEQARIDLERLELVRKRREEQRLKRIADEGYDRFAPITETNRPPLPSDYKGPPQ